MSFKAINFKKWIDENRDKLKPPVCNQVIYKDNEDFIIMVVGGPNIRKDYHYNEGEEWFYQLEGDMVLKLMVDGKPEDVEIKEGEIFLLPPRIPHSPQRFENTIGLVIERYRTPEEKDAFLWYCDNCHNQLHKELVNLTDIVKQLPPLMQGFKENKKLRTCSKCGEFLELP